MINWTLYQRGMRGSRRILIIFAAVLTLYFTTIISMFDPTLGSALDELLKAMPEMMEIFGMNPTSGELVSFLSAYLYGFLMLLFPMVFSILSVNKLITRHMDQGSMSYLLAAPVKRVSIAFTQISVLCTGLFALILYSTLLGIVACELSFPGQLAVGQFVLLNTGLLCLQLFIGAICLLCSCIFNDSKYVGGFGAGIPALAFILQMIANAGKGLENVKYVTFFSLFDPDGIIAGEASAIWGVIVLFIGAVILFQTAMIIFNKKDMHV